MAEETWHAARLIPTSGISGAEEQERRATSALLAVMLAVKDFAKSIIAPLGGPAGRLETFIEVPFILGDRKVYPDGLIRVTRGPRSWVALVEVKTGSNRLEAPQLEAYLDVAREQGFDAVLTISNEIPPIAGTHPTAVDRRKLRKAALHHLSWTQVLTEAVMHKVHRGVADPEQAWILGELIRYLEHPRSGAMEFDDMGTSWVAVREGVAAGTLRPNDKGAAEVASRWDQLLRYACLRLGRQLGVEVQPALTRKGDRRPDNQGPSPHLGARDRGQARWLRPHPQCRRSDLPQCRPSGWPDNRLRRHRCSAGGSALTAGELADSPTQGCPGHRPCRLLRCPRSRRVDVRTPSRRPTRPRVTDRRPEAGTATVPAGAHGADGIQAGPRSGQLRRCCSRSPGPVLRVDRPDHQAVVGGSAQAASGA